MALSCLTKSVLTLLGGFDPKRDLNPATLNKGLPTRLFSEDKRFLVVQIHYRHYPGDEGKHMWCAQVEGYNYELLDGEEHRMVAYHWHPHGIGSVTWPHLHLGAGALAAGSMMHKSHLPTGGPVSLPSFARTLIDECHVSACRDDWKAVLERAETDLARLQDCP